MPHCEQGLQPAFSATACFAPVCSSSCKRYRKVKMRKPENRVLINEIRPSGRVAEWLKAPDSKFEKEGFSPFLLSLESIVSLNVYGPLLHFRFLLPFALFCSEIPK